MLDILVMPCTTCSNPFEKTTWNKKYCSKLCKEGSPYNRSRQAKFREGNRERQKSLSKRHYELNREVYIERAKVWKLEHPEETRESSSRRRKIKYHADPIADLAKQHARRASMRGTFTKEEWDAIPLNNLCSYCGKDGRMTIDHVVPISSGGPNTADNIVPACGKCNSSKGNKPLIVYLATRSN